MYFVFRILALVAKIIEKSNRITLKKCNLYFIIEILFFKVIGPTLVSGVSFMQYGTTFLVADYSADQK